MADDQIEISVTLDDGSVRQGFARIRKEGDQAADGLSSSFQGATKAVLGLAAAYLSLRAITNVFKSAIDAAIDQENAINRLNNSLKLAGTFSKEASLSFQSLAETIQNTTTVEDDQALALAALARNFTRTNEQAKELTLAAIDLAAATGVDASTAVQQLGGTLDGVTGRLGSLVPALDNLTKAQLEAGLGVRLLADRFRGAAEGEVNTFSGRLTQLSNKIGDFFEELGGPVVRSPAIIATIKTISDVIGRVTDSLKTFSQGQDFFKALIIGLAQFGQGLVKFVIAPLEVGFNGFITFIKAIETGFRVLLVPIAAVGDAVKGTFDAISQLSNGFFQAVVNGKDLKETLAAQEEPFAFKATSQALQDLDASAKNTRETFKSLFTNLDVSNPLFDLFADLESNVAIAGQQFDTLSNKAGETAGKISAQAQSINKAIQEAILRSISAGITAFVGALVKGQNGFEAFGKAVLGIIGDLAIQIGTILVGIGLSIEKLKVALSTLSGGVAIAAGLALIAIGGLLKSLSGGGVQGATSGSVASGSGGGFVPTNEAINPADEIDRERQSKVTVNIQGDVLDSNETGLRIVQLINEAGFSQGARSFA